MVQNLNLFAVKRRDSVKTSSWTTRESLSGRMTGHWLAAESVHSMEQ